MDFGISEVDQKDVFENEFFNFNRFMLKIAGLWPYQKKFVKNTIRTVMLVAITSMMLPLIIRMIYEWGKNVAIVVENITGFCYFQGIIAKYISNFLTERQLKYLYERITADYARFTDKDEQRVLLRNARWGRLLSVGYVVYLAVCATGFLLSPMVLPSLLNFIVPSNETREKMMCFYGEYFIDQQVYYYEIMIHTVVCALCTVLLYATIDSTYVSCVQHVVGLFKLVELYLSKALDLTQNNNSKSVKVQNEIHDYVVKSIALHDEALQFVDLLQSTYSYVLLFTTVDVLFGICFGTITVMMNTDNYVNLVRVSSVYCGVTTYLFYTALPGQRITDASSAISEAIFYAGWFDFPLKTQKLVRFMLLRCSRPCEFMAGPLLVLNVEVCGAVLRSAMSYCTFVQSMT